MIQLDGSLRGRGAVQLHWHGWVPCGQVRAVLAFSHGLCDHGGRYAPLAYHLAEAGIATYALDHRGHGRSMGARAHIDRMAFAASDLAAFVHLVSGRHSDEPLFLCGHSMGCVIVLEYLLQAGAPPLSGLALCAPTVDVSAAPPIYLRCASVLSRVAPRVGIISVFGRESGDATATVADDPYIYRGRASARTIAEILMSVRRLPQRLHRIHHPVLLQHGTEDRLVPAMAAELVYDGVASRDKSLKLYEGMGHDILALPAARARNDLADWIVDRSPTRWRR